MRLWNPSGDDEGTSVDVDLRQLRSFVAVAELLHFGRAAKALGVTRPSLSHTVIELESELRVKLFVPGAQPTALTEAGRTLLEDARQRLAEEELRRLELAAAAAAPAEFTVGFAPGVTLTKWSRIWAQRAPDVELKVLSTTSTDQAAVLHDGRAAVSFVRLPVDRDGLSVIPLYSEVPVVVVPKEHAVSLFDHVSVADLADEHLLQDPDELPEWRDTATEVRTGRRRTLPPIGSIEDAIELVAAGVGIVIVPQSIARLHTRRDLVYRPVTDVAPTQIALAWVADGTTDHIEQFVGIVQGRTANSSRSAQQPTAGSPTTKRGSPPSKGSGRAPTRSVPKKAARRRRK